VKVGPNSWVGANFTVRRDIPANTLVLPKQDEAKYKSIR